MGNSATRRRCDDRQVDRAADRRKRRVRALRKDVPVMRIDGEDLTLEAAFEQILEDDAAERPGALGRAHERDRLRTNERPQVMMHGEF